MIKSFKNKYLEKFYTEGDDTEIKGVDKRRLKIILAQLDAADEIKDCKIPSFNFEKIQKKGFYSISVGSGKKLVFKLTPSKK